MSDRVSPVVVAALDRVVSDNGWLAASRPGPLRASLSDVLGSEADQHRAELDAVVVSAEEGIPSALRTAGRAAARGLAPELTQRLVEWGMTEPLAASVVDAWASLVPEISSSAPVVGGDSTIVSVPKEPEPVADLAHPPARAAAAAPAVGLDETTMPPAVTSPPDSSAPRGTPNRSYLWMAGAVAVLLVIGSIAWLGIHKRSHHDAPLLAMLTSAIGPAHGLVPTKACTATSDHAVCTRPSSSITRLELQSYPDLQSLYAAYRARAEALRGAPLQENDRNCNAHVRSGEVSWNHDYQHPKTYSIEDHISQDLTRHGAAEGRLACEVSGSYMTIVWTDDCGTMLGQIEGPVMGLFGTWKALHHNIVPPGCKPMATGDMPSPSSQSTSMGDMPSASQ